MSEAVRISKQDLAQKIEQGWKKDQLAAHFNLPMAQMTKVLQEAGLTIRKFHRPKYVLVDDVVEPAVEDVNNTHTEEEVETAVQLENVTEEVTQVPEGW